MQRICTRALASVASFFGRSQRKAKPAFKSVRPTLDHLEARDVPTASGWVAGTPPAQMSFTTNTPVTINPNTAKGGFSVAIVKDNVTRDFIFTAPTSGDYLINTSQAVGHAAIDTVLGVYDSAGTRLAFNDDTGRSRFSAVHVNLVAGHQYKVGIGHYHTSIDTLSRYTAFTIDGPDKAVPPPSRPPVTPPVQPPVTPPAVNLGQNVVDFAHARLGQTVANGQCAGLVDAALRAAGAQTFSDLGPVGADADYVWGTRLFQFNAGDPISLFDQLRPGDIIQFRDVTLFHSANGFTSSNSFPHHTAIVEANLGGGNLRLLEQNVNGVQRVLEDTYSFADMNGGTLWAYRPIA